MVLGAKLATIGCGVITMIGAAFAFPVARIVWVNGVIAGVGEVAGGFALAVDPADPVVDVDPPLAGAAGEPTPLDAGTTSMIANVTARPPYVICSVTGMMMISGVGVAREEELVGVVAAAVFPLGEGTTGPNWAGARTAGAIAGW
jgi:hypothetical protein